MYKKPTQIYFLVKKNNTSNGFFFQLKMLNFFDPAPSVKSLFDCYFLWFISSKSLEKSTKKATAIGVDTTTAFP